MPSTEFETFMRCLLTSLSLSCAVLATPVAAQDLNTAIADALGQAPAIAEASAGEAAAKARLDRARAERNPLLRLEGSVGTGRIDNQGFFGFAPANTTPLALQAVGELPLYAGGRTAAAMAQAKGGSDMARLQAEQTRLQTIVQAVATYAEVLTARQLEARFDRLVTALVETERQAQLRFRTGDIASSELAQTRARRAEADAGFAQAQGRRLSAEAAYARVTGKMAGALDPLPALPVMPATLDEALDHARHANPSLRQAQAAVAVARSGVRAAKAEGMPMIGAFAEAGRVRDQFFPNYQADSVAVGVRGRWTLWAGGRVAAQTHAASAELNASTARERAASQQLDGMVIDAWQAVQTSQRMVTASTLRSEAAAEALRGTRLETQVGAKPTLALLDAEREAIEAEAARIEAEAMRTVAAWRLNALTATVQP
jgi:outer membrane protein